MKNLNLLIRNGVFWLIVYGIVCTFTIVIMAIVWSKHECPKLDKAPLEQKIVESNLKIQKYERELLIKNAVIENYNNRQLDSVWSRIHKNN